MDHFETQKLQHKKVPAGVFLATVFVVFVLTLSAADSIGLVPNYIDGTSATDSVSLSDIPQLGSLETIRVVAQQAIQEGILPERIKAPAIGLDLPVQNPATRDIDKLTQVLVNGPARYVDSAKLGEKGNMIVFGHSSRLPIVRNKMYKAFNEISNLKAGDAVTVSGADGKEFLYVVTTVRIADAEEDVISLSKDSTRLTLVTCNVLGEKTSRFIVEAELVGSVASAS